MTKKEFWLKTQLIYLPRYHSWRNLCTNCFYEPREELTMCSAHGHGTRLSSDHGNYWVVVEINGARNVAYWSSDGRRLTLRWMATFLHQGIRQRSIKSWNMEPDRSPSGTMVLSDWWGNKKRWESLWHPSESTTHQDRLCTPNGHMKPHQISILFESHSFPLRLQNEACTRSLIADQYPSQGKGS